MTPHSSLPLVWTHCLFACLCPNCLLNLYCPKIGRITFTYPWEWLAWVLAIYPCSLILAESSGVLLFLWVYFPKNLLLMKCLAWILSTVPMNIVNTSLIWLSSFPLGIRNHLGKWCTWYIIWNDDGKVPYHDFDLVRTSCIASLLCEIMPLVGFSRWLFVHACVCLSSCNVGCSKASSFQLALVHQQV